jgi:hypothetical protein
MAQVFHPAANTLARVSIIAAAAAPLVLILSGSQITRTYGQQVNVPIEQPVPFSHEHHTNELGIACQYCHQQAEQGPWANIPATEVCMSCHSQIWTNSPLWSRYASRIARACRSSGTRSTAFRISCTFNHSIHVAKGIPCQHCHGNINQMQITYRSHPFFMAWCLECHRAPEKYIRPREQVYNFAYDWQKAAERYFEQTGRENEKLPRSQNEFGKLLVQDYHINKKQLSDCWICHR